MPVPSPKHPVVALVLIFVPLVSAACGAGPTGLSVREDSTADARCANVETTTASSHPDARAYAEDFGVDLQEAVRRLELQEHAGDLSAELAEKEPETFVGLHIEHQPEYRVITRFTRDGEETIRPYVQCGPLEDVVEVREVPRPDIAQLEADLDEARRIVNSVGIPADANIDEINNRAELFVTDRERLEAALRENDLRLPDRVVVIEVRGLDEPR